MERRRQPKRPCPTEAPCPRHRRSFAGGVPPPPPFCGASFPFFPRRFLWRCVRAPCGRANKRGYVRRKAPRKTPSETNPLNRSRPASAAPPAPLRPTEPVKPPPFFAAPTEFCGGRPPAAPLLWCLGFRLSAAFPLPVRSMANKRSDGGGGGGVSRRFSA